MPTLIATALVLALGACGGEQKAPAGPGAGAPPPPEVGVVTVTTQPVPLTTELPGRVEASRVAQVRARVTGIVQGVRLISVQKVTVDARPQSEHWRGVRSAPSRKCLSGNEFLLVLQSAVERLFVGSISAGGACFRRGL